MTNNEELSAKIVDAIIKGWNDWSRPFTSRADAEWYWKKKIEFNILHNHEKEKLDSIEIETLIKLHHHLDICGHNINSNLKEKLREIINSNTK